MALTKPATLTGSIEGSTANDNNTLLFGTSGDDTITGGLAATDIDDITSDGIDTMEGGAGNDTYIVHNTLDSIIEIAGGGTDTVWTTSTYTLAAEVENIGAAGTNNTVLTGNAKDNILDGSQDTGNGTSTGFNTLTGGLGNDTYFLGTGDKVIEAASAGTDTVYAGFSVNLTNATATGIAGDADDTKRAVTVAAIDNVYLTGSSAANITGNALNNLLVGNSGANSIVGGAGNDILDTGAGGADTLDGGAGNDTYIIRSGVTPTFATTQENAAGGIDLVQSFVTVNTSGTFLENIALKGSAAISATGNDLNNTLTGNDAANTLSGGIGNDTLVGAAGSDSLSGGANNDTLNGGSGTNTLNGGAGNDTYLVFSSSDVLTSELATAGEIDTVTFSGTSGVLEVGANIETITLSGTSDIGATANNATAHTMTGNSGANSLTGGSLADNITGNAGNDTLTGNAGNDGLNGGDGNDSISGGDGVDNLTGGAGTNTLNGGAGNDTYNVSSSTDTVTGEAATAGEIDSVIFSGTSGVLTVGNNIETITLSGTAGIGVDLSSTSVTHTITGNTGSNSITGGSGVDNINGGTGAGNDTLTGGNGSDNYTIDSASDVVVEVDTDGDTDVVTANLTAVGTVDLSTDGAGVETLILGGALAINGTGNAQANTINGNGVANVISGLGGNDTINGGIGNDTIIGGAGKDTIVTGTGNDTIRFASGVTDTVAAASSIAGVDKYTDLVLNGASADLIDLTGVTQADLRVGGAITVGTVTEATFISNMNTLLTTNGLGFETNVGGTDIDFAVVTATAGDLSGHKFLAIDLDSSDTFTATDFVIEITGSTVTSLTTATFV